MKTRDQLAQEAYGKPYAGLLPSQQVAVDKAFDAQAADAPETKGEDFVTDPEDGKTYQIIYSENGEPLSRKEVDPKLLTAKQKQSAASAGGAGGTGAAVPRDISYLSDGRAIRTAANGAISLAPEYDQPALAKPPTAAEQQSALYRDQIKAAAGKYGIDASTLPQPGPKQPQATDAGGNLLDQYGQLFSLTRDASGNPTGEGSATNPQGAANLGTPGVPRPGNGERRTRIVNLDEYTRANYGKSMAELGAADAMTAAKAKAAWLAQDDWSAEDTASAAAIETNNMEAQRSRQQQSQALSYAEERKRRARASGGLSGAELNSPVYMALGGSISAGGVGTAAFKGITPQVSYNDQREGLGWMDEQLEYENQRRMNGGRTSKNVNGERWDLQPNGKWLPYEYNQPGDVYQETQPNGQPWSGPQNAGFAGQQAGQQPQGQESGSNQPVCDTLGTGPRTPAPVQPPVQPPVVTQLEPERTRSTVLMNSGGRVSSTPVTDALGAPPISQNAMGQPQIKANEELGVVGLSSGKLYSVLQESMDGVGGMMEHESMVTNGQSLDVQPLPGGPMPAPPMGNTPVTSALGAPPVSGPTTTSPTLLKLLALASQPKRIKVAA